jgi:hypothetical protein
MKKVSLILAFLLPSLLLAAQFRHVFGRYDYAAMGLMVILDDSEREVGASHLSLYTALFQKPAPLILSASLAAKALSEDVLDKSPDELLKDFNRAHLIYKQENDETVIRDRRKIFLKASRFSIDEWVIKKINDHLLLFIPTCYLPNRAMHSGVAHYDPKRVDSFSEVEYLLGIKVNHMETISTLSAIRKLPQFTGRSDYFVDALPSIFLTRADYSNVKKTLPFWSIYLEGHGLKGQSIAGMDLALFPKVLNFFELKLNINIFVYTSCYAASYNNEILFKEQQENIQKSYSYPIVSQIYTDTPATQHFVDVEVKNGVFQLRTGVFLKDFFEESYKTPFEYASLLRLIFPIAPAHLITEAQIKDRHKSPVQQFGDMAQVKLPGQEWFSLLALNTDNVVSIGAILSETRDSEKPLNIKGYFKKDPEVILLYGLDMPFSIDLGKNLKSFISAVPGDAMHRIRKITSNEMSLRDIVMAFMSLDKLDAKKIFYVGEIIGKDSSAHDVVIVNDKLAAYAFGEDLYERYAVANIEQLINNITPQNSNFETIKNQNRLNFYKSFMAELKGEMLKLGDINAEEKEGKIIYYPELSNNLVTAMVNSISSAENDKYSRLGSLITLLHYKIGRGHYLFINHMSAAANNMDLGLPEVIIEVGTRTLWRAPKTTLTNVVIKSDGTVLFTYENGWYSYDIDKKTKTALAKDYSDTYRTIKRQDGLAKTRWSLLPATELSRQKAIKIAENLTKKLIPQPEARKVSNKRFVKNRWDTYRAGRYYLTLTEIDILPDDLYEKADIEELILLTDSNSPLKKGVIIGGQLPDKIVELTTLKLIRIGSSELEHLPVHIGKLKNLRELSIFGSKLSSLPSSIEDLTLIEELNLSNGNFTEVPSQIRKLKNLRILRIDGNKITSLPDWIGELESLEFLVFSRNPFPENYKFPLASLKQMRHLKYIYGLPSGDIINPLFLPGS